MLYFDFNFILQTASGRNHCLYLNNNVILLEIFFLLSNYTITTAVSVTVFFNCMFPIVIILYKFEPEQFNKICRIMLSVFNIFIFCLLLLAIFEKFTGNIIINFLAGIFSNTEITGNAVSAQSGRFASIWGRALTHALLFNIFFILNDIYYKCIHKKYPKILFFLVAAGGVLLCASKTAVVVLGVYFLISSYKDKKILLLCALGGIALFAIGGFNLLLNRIQTTSLTSGRIETLKIILQNGWYPFRFFKGYGQGTVYTEKLYWAKAAYEFPLLMHALDYGILFSVVLIGSIYVYVSYSLLKRRYLQFWLGYSLIFAEFNTYNGICLYNQDVFIWLCVVSVMVINISRLQQAAEEEEVSR